MNSDSATMHTTVIQAPWVNRVVMTTTSTAAEITAASTASPSEATIRRRPETVGSARRWRRQCRAMPNWVSVKDTNTPTT